LTKVSEFFFQNQPDGEEKVLSILGFNDKSDYEAAQEVSHRGQPLLAEKVANWEDQEKKEKILELFISLEKLGKIRHKVFPEWLQGRTSEAHRYYKTLADRIILRVLECKDWDDYNRKRRNLHARRRYQKRKEEGTLRNKAAIKAALERDGHKCVISGAKKGISVHHIDGDRINDRLDNLVTLSKEIHQAVHNGARAYAGSDLVYWSRRDPQYVQRLEMRMDYMEKYVAYLKKSGYDDARIECISGYDLYELEKHLNIRTRQKRVDGWYYVVVLQPTGCHGEPKEFVPKTSYFDFDDIEQKCEDCPHEGDPPCIDFHPGPYCLP
jgi:hypothetical protein